MKKIVNKRAIFLSLLLMCLLSSECSSCDDKGKEIVKKYYEFDLSGVRIGASDDKIYNFSNLYLWEGEPGWDYAFIVDKINIHNVKKIDNKYESIEVKYHVVGILGGDELYSYEFNELVDFTLVEKDKLCKIAEPKIPPHISISTAIKTTEKLIEMTEDKVRQKKLKYLVLRLKDMLAPVNR